MSKSNTALTPEQFKKAADNPKSKKQFTHESGLTYYPVKLNKIVKEGEQRQEIELRLFEDLSPKRLEFETYDEYKLRKAYIKKADKKYKKGTLVWNAKWGTFNKINALKVQEAINQNK